MKPVFIWLALAALVFVMSFGHSTVAEASNIEVALPSVQASGSVGAGAAGIDPEDSSSQLPIALATSYDLSSAGLCCGMSSATLTAIGGTDPSLAMEVAAQGYTWANASGEIIYPFEIVPNSTNSLSTSASVVLAGDSTFSTATPASASSGSVTICLDSACADHVQNSVGATNGLYTDSLVLNTDTIYYADLQGSAYATGLLPGGGTTTSFAQSVLDPTLTPEPGYSTLYGADLLAATATPLPPTWTMMLIGLVGLGFIACRSAAFDHRTAGVEGRPRIKRATLWIRPLSVRAV